MKKIILLCLLASTLFHAQNYTKITYSLEFISDSTQIQNKQNERFILIHGESMSKFQSEGKYKQDSTLYTFKDVPVDHGNFAQAFSIMQKMPKTQFRDIITKNFTQQELIVYTTIGLNNLHYAEENFVPMNWALINETKTFGEDICQKASNEFRGRKYEAWYNPNIPIHDGPYKFHGLPGLLYEVYDVEKHYHYQLIKIEKIQKPTEREQKKSTKISRPKMIEMKKNFAENPSVFFKNDMIQLDTENMQKLKQRQKEKLKQQNNPIELKDF